MDEISRTAVADVCLILSVACMAWVVYSYIRDWREEDRRKQEEVDLARFNLQRALDLRDAVDRRLEHYRGLIEDRERRIRELSQGETSVRLSEEHWSEERSLLEQEIQDLQARILEFRVIRGEVRSVDMRVPDRREGDEPSR
jgi:chromosome segregation ATPase